MSTTITVIGNLAADPELRFTPQGKAVASFTVMASKSRKNDAGQWENIDTTGWAVKAWDSLAENIAESLHKGDSVVVVGNAAWKSWEKDDGSKGGRMEITAFNVGADLRRATATVKKATRSGAPATESDPWTSDPNEVPF